MIDVLVLKNRQRHRAQLKLVLTKCLRMRLLELTVQVIGWDTSGTIVFNAVACTQNTAGGYRGCFRGAGRNTVNDGTVMHDNEAAHGGCICERRMPL